MKAMLLAAGLGTRMAPVSDKRAKPTLPLLDRPVLRWLVDALADQGITGVVVNAHSYPDQVRSAVEGTSIPVEISDEPALLGSGGGLLAAREYLEGTGTFLLVNADMYLDFRVEELLSAHRKGGAMATLALWPDPGKHEFGTIGYGSGGRVSRITDLADRGGEEGCGLFCGVHAMESEVFEYLSRKTTDTPARLEIKPDFWVPLLEADQALHVWLQPPDSVWWPIGTPRELLDANLAALDRFAASESWVARDAVVPASARIGPGAVIGAGARVPEGATVREALLLPDARPSDTDLVRAIAFDTEVWRDG